MLAMRKYEATDSLVLLRNTFKKKKTNHTLTTCIICLTILKLQVPASINVTCINSNQLPDWQQQEKQKETVFWRSDENTHVLYL